MGRKLKHPQIADLMVGQSITIPIEHIGNLPTFRSKIYQYNKRYDVYLSVRDEGETVTVVRMAQRAEDYINYTVAGYSQPFEQAFPEKAAIIRKAFEFAAAEILKDL